MRTGLTNIQWCPGCGDTIIVMAIKKALAELEITSSNRVVVSGIGCSGKASQYIDGYGAETLHGRSIPFATGVKLAKPNMTILAVGGDGDGFGIGLSHFLHACRRDIDITYLVFNNENYALTTGQASPTTQLGSRTKTTPEGNTMPPLDPVIMAKSAGCKYAKSADGKDFKGLIEIIKKAIEHKGFSFVNIKQDCPTYNKL